MLCYSDAMFLKKCGNLFVLTNFHISAVDIGLNMPDNTLAEFWICVKDAN